MHNANNDIFILFCIKRYFWLKVYILFFYRLFRILMEKLKKNCKRQTARLAIIWLVAVHFHAVCLKGGCDNQIDFEVLEKKNGFISIRNQVKISFKICTFFCFQQTIQELNITFVQIISICRHKSWENYFNDKNNK